MKFWIYFVFIAGIFHGCSAQNQSIEEGNPHLIDANIQSIQVGMHGDEVLAILGAPDETVNYEDGAEDWIYRGVEGEWVRPTDFSKKTTRIRAKRFEVKINPDGLVINVIYDESDEKTRSVF